MRDVAGRGSTVGDQAGGGVRGDLGRVLLLPGQDGQPEPVVRGVVQTAVAVAVVRLRGLAQELERSLVIGAAGQAGQRLIGGKNRHETDPLVGD